jgi:glycine/D-amino acid oxidase-like deaminating enzyme
LDIAERAVLERGRGEWNSRPDVLVVGGGIMGVATALACQQADLGSVQLIEASNLGSGATGGSAGLLQPEPHHGSDPTCLVELGRMSLQRWRQLEAGVTDGVGLVDQAWIGLAPHPEPFLVDPPSTVQWLDPDEVGRLIPDMAAAPAGALIAHQGRLNPLRAVARLAHGLSHVATGVSATRVSVDRQRVTAVSTTAGIINPGVVVFATANPPAIDGLNLAVPADLIKGHLLVTQPTDIRLPGTVAPVAIPIEHQRLLVGGTLDLGDHSPAVRDEVIAALHAQLTAALPATADIAVSHRWCCWRPHHPDGLPVIDQLPGVDNAWLTSGHYRTGLLMGPATGDLLAEWIVTGRRPDMAAPFNITRFSTRAS